MSWATKTPLGGVFAEVRELMADCARRLQWLQPQGRMTSLVGGQSHD